TEILSLLVKSFSCSVCLVGIGVPHAKIRSPHELFFEIVVEEDFEGLRKHYDAHPITFASFQRVAIEEQRPKWRANIVAADDEFCSAVGRLTCDNCVGDCIEAL